MIEDNGNGNGLSHTSKVIHDLTWRGCHIVRRNDQQGISARLFGMLGQFDSCARGVVMGSSDNWQATRVGMNGSLQDSLPIVYFQGDEFARTA